MGDVEKSESRLLEHFGIIVNPSRMDVNSAFSQNLDISDGLFQIANGEGGNVLRNRFVCSG